MSNDQQQILFDEADSLKSDQSIDEGNSQLIFDNQDYLPTDIDNESVDSIQNIENELLEKHKPHWLWRTVFVLFTVIVTLEMVDFFTSGFIESPVITGMFAVILLCLLLIGSRVLFRELSGLRQFKQRQKTKNRAINFIANETGGTTAEKFTDTTFDAEKFCANISQNLPCDLMSEQEHLWQDALAGEHSQVELLQLYSRLVLSKVDDKALTEVAKFSTEAVVLVALSPIAIVDMLIMLWRNLRLIDKITGLYGLKLGYWSRIKLIKQVFVNMVYAGASELIADFGAEMIGADLLGKLSGRLAQGLGAGMLTARLGVKTMQLCRPLPFDDGAPKLKHVRKEVLATIKGFIKSKNT